MSEARHRPGSEPFPTTQVSVIGKLVSADPAVRRRCREIVAGVYWKPVYKYVRLRWRVPTEEAQDLTQGFFASAFERSFFEGYDPAKARFRTFLRLCLDRYVQNEAKARRRIKRGGDAVVVSLEVTGAEGELAAVDVAALTDLDEFFADEYRRSIFGAAVQALRATLEAREMHRHFRVFERYDLEGGDAKTSYQAVARELGITADDVTNSLRFARREFRRLVLEKLREITANEEEFELEARALLGGSRNGRTRA